MLVRGSRSSAGERREREGLALYDECEVGEPCARCKSNNSLIPVPDGDAG
jgi:hypothetical protein